MGEEIARVTPTWQEVYDAKIKLDATQRDRVEALQGQAVAYVWGYQDATDSGSKNTGESSAFGHAYALHVARYELGIIGCRHNIGDSFKRWTAGQPIERQN